MDLKPNDILNVRLSIEVDIPEEDMKNSDFSYEDYERCYSVFYSLGGQVYYAADEVFPVGAGDVDIKEWVAQDIIYDTQIKEYEIFDIKDYGNYQTAKIKVISIKKQQEK